MTYKRTYLIPEATGKSLSLSEKDFLGEVEPAAGLKMDFLGLAGPVPLSYEGAGDGGGRSLSCLADEPGRVRFLSTS